MVIGRGQEPDNVGVLPHPVYLSLQSLFHDDGVVGIERGDMRGACLADSGMEG